MKKIIVFIVGLFFVYSFSVYQGCKQTVAHCILLQKVWMLPYNNNTGEAMDANDSVLAKKLSINITFDTKEFSCLDASTFSFINSAYAYKTKPSFLYYDTLKSIQITCMQDFDSTHLAGSLLNSYFAVPESFQSSIEFTKAYSYNLKTMPDTEMLYEFRVVVEFNGGAVYDTILPPVKIIR